MWRRMLRWLRAAGGRTKCRSGVLASSVPRDVIDDAVAGAGRAAKRSDGKLPPHVMVYFVMAMALFAEDDYEEVAARLAGTLGLWGCWDARWQNICSTHLSMAHLLAAVRPIRRRKCDTLWFSGDLPGGIRRSEY